jgi:tetratricopeptide (TPR) repeat protein
LFHLGRYTEAAEAYWLGIAAGEALRAQLYVNLGNALHSSFQFEKRDVLAAAIDALREGARLADDPRLEVEARACLGGALIEARQLDDAESVLAEAWSLAQDRRSVPHKARMMVKRNEGVIDLARGRIPAAIAKFDAAIDFAVAHFGPCHPELVDLYRNVLVYLSDAVAPSRLVDRMLKMLAGLQATCGVTSGPVQQFAETLEMITRYAMQRARVQAREPQILSLVRRQAGRVWDASAIQAMVRQFRN